MRIVPSTGFITAWYAASAAAVKASAVVRASATPTPLKTAVSPRRIWERITPEFPRAPISDPWLTALHVEAMSSPAPSSSDSTDSTVSAMLVPVSPSGTG